jgi:hypothetical protein
MKKLLTLIALVMPLCTYALGLINDFEWLEPNNRVEIVVGEPYQLKFNCSDNSLPFTSDYADYWNHYDFEGGQHMISTPSGYSIDEKGVITGLVPGSYAIKFTGYILAKSGVDKMLMITVVSERSETEPNNTFDTANEIYTKIRFGLYNTSDIDFFKFTNSNLKWGDNVTFKIHYYGSREAPFGYKWSTFCGTDMIGSGSLISQDQECKALVTSGNTVYLEIYYDQSRSQYFNYGEEFVIEMYINGELVQLDNNNGGYEEEAYVDLGLPSGTLWATCNLGAESKFTVGDYYAWGETSTKSEYTRDNYKWGSQFFYTKYVTTSEYGIVDGKVELDREDDAAYVNLGEGWRMPTMEEWQELSENCSWRGYSDASTNYNLVTEGTGPNGNKIYLAVTGDRGGYGSSEWGFYWTKNLYTTDNEMYLANTIQCLGSIIFNRDWRYLGLNIRPIYDPNYTSIKAIYSSEKNKLNKKYVRHGHIEIERNGKTYTATGVQIK